MTSRSQYLPTSRDSQRPLPSAPHIDEALPNYDTALKVKTLKIHFHYSYLNFTIVKSTILS